MDARRFDAFTRVLSTPESRRRLLPFLAGLPVAVGLLGFVSPDDAAGKKHHKKHHRKHHQKPATPGCVPSCTPPQTCGGGGAPGVCGCTAKTCKAGQCGAIDDGCGGVLPCDCPAGENCCNGACSLCPCDQVQLSNGTCVIPCANSGPCGPAPCRCYSTPGYCGGDETGTHCSSDDNCPQGQFCNGFSGLCAIVQC